MRPGHGANAAALPLETKPLQSISLYSGWILKRGGRELKRLDKEKVEGSIQSKGVVQMLPWQPVSQRCTTLLITL